MSTTLAQRQDINNQLTRAKTRLHQRALEKAQSRVQLAGLLSTMAAKTTADERRMLNSAIQDMALDELKAWVEYAEEEFEELTRADWEEWTLLGSALTTAYTRLDRAE